jgi:hypothetical protein
MEIVMSFIWKIGYYCRDYLNYKRQPTPLPYVGSSPPPHAAHHHKPQDPLYFR